MKKITVILALMLLCASFAGCKNEKEPSIDNTKTPDVSQQQGEALPVEQKKEPVATLLNLYFPDDQALYLHKEQRVVGIVEGESVERAILEQLFVGPKTNGLSPSLDGEDLINSVSVDENGLCTVDFKSDFVLLNTGGTARESYVIGSIVNSLCELEHINSVKINIDGKTDAEFGHSTLDSVFVPQEDLISK